MLGTPGGGECQEGQEVESRDPNGLNGVTKESMLCRMRAVKKAQVEEKHCCHCSSVEHFIYNCPLVKASGTNMCLNCKEGTAPKKGAQAPHMKATVPKKKTPGGGSQGIESYTQTPFLNPDPFQCWYGVENVAKVKINRESCIALLDNGTQINTIMPSYVKSPSLEMGLITDLISGRVTCIGLGNTYTQPLGYVVVKVQVHGVQGYNEDQIALVVPDLLNFAERIPAVLGTPTISHVLDVIREREREIDALAMPWANARVAHLLPV